MNPEKKLTTENLQPTTEEPTTTPGILSESAAKQIIENRRQSLSELKSELSLKMYYLLEEKIKREERALYELLDLQQGHKKVLSKYTFVLDPQYFEQLFFNDRI